MVIELEQELLWGKEKMQPDICYTLKELKIYWNHYWHKSGFRYLTKGKWKYDFSGKPITNIDATRAEVTLLRNHITFPEFLEKYGKDKH